MDIFYPVFDFLNYFIWYACLNTCLSFRFKKSLSYPLELLIIVLSYLISILLPLHSAARSICYMVFLFSTDLLLFKERWQKVVFTQILIIAVVMINDIISVGFYLPEEMVLRQPNLPFSLSFLLRGLLYSVMEFSFLSLLAMFLKRRSYMLGTKEYLLFAGFPLSQILLYLSVVFALGQYEIVLDSSYFALCGLICLGADAALFIALVRMAQRKMLLAENKRLAALMDKQDEHYTALTSHYEELRRMRHDMENQLIAVKNLFKEGQNQQAEDYLENLINSEPLKRRAVCENPVLDSFLSDKLSEAEKKGIEIKSEISLKSYAAIPNLDLVRAFGNIIDNAVEACGNTEKPLIELKAHESKGYLLISCSNSFSPEEKPKKERIPGLQRGLGQQVLSCLAKNHQGSFETEKKDGIYSMKLFLKTEEDSHAKACNL